MQQGKRFGSRIGVVFHGIRRAGNQSGIFVYENKTEKEPNEAASRQIPPMERVCADVSSGLTAQQVESRILNGAVNSTADQGQVTLMDIVKENVFTYFNLIFAVIAVTLFLVGSFRDMAFLPVIISNTLIGIIQEWRSKKLLDKLTIMNAPRCSVIRDGVQEEIPSEELVLDDIVLLSAGNQIPADARIISGEVSVNESLLTGEADEITRRTGEELLSGSFVTSGECFARLEKVGPDSYSSRLALEAKARKSGEQSEMIRALDRLVKITGVIIIPIAILLFRQQFFVNGESFRSSVTGTAAAIIGMIPEGLYLLASVALAVSAMRLAVNHVLVHNMKSIETLARVDVLCVDKTGTITQDGMEVQKVILLRSPEEMKQHPAGASNLFYYGNKQESIPSGNDESPDPAREPESLEGQEGQDGQDAAQGDTEVAIGATWYEKKALEALEVLLGDFSAAMHADNSTIQAMKTYFTAQSGRRAQRVIPFSQKYKYSAADFGNRKYVLGAPEWVLKEKYEYYRELIDGYAVQGYRVVVFGEYPGDLEEGPLKESVLPIGAVLLSNAIRENAAETFRYFDEQQVKVKVISGDNPLTVSRVSQEAGIPGAHRFVDATGLSDDDLASACEKYTVFGRVTPVQKRKLIAALKKKGHTVAMTGDGVNDVLALREADCSVAMASGSDAAAQSAQVVLLESDFSKMPAVVLEGRRVVNNIERTASLFLVKNIFSFFLSIFTIVLKFGYPLEPSQVSLISMFTIGIPALMMSLEKNRGRIQGHFLSNVFYKALPAGLTDFAVISSLVVFCKEFAVSGEDLSTSCTILLAIVGIMILYRIASPMNCWHWIMWCSMIFGLVFCMTFLNHIFSLSMMSRKCFMLLIIFAILTEPVLRYLGILTETVWKLASSLRQFLLQQKEKIIGIEKI